MEKENSKNKIMKNSIKIIAIILCMVIIIGLIVLLNYYKQKKIQNDLNTISKLIQDNDYNGATEKLNELSEDIRDDEEINKELNQLREKTKQEEIKKLKNKQEVTVEEANIVVSNSEYKSLYPDGIEVIIKNNTEKTIKDYEVSILGYDTNNFPVKIKRQFNFGNTSYEFIGQAEATNIMPGATYGKNFGWELDENHGISKVISIVKTVKYYDGTTWENPYYKYWIEEYKEKPLNSSLEINEQ